MKSNQITIGILAHVDAGKTTLSESLLYHTGQLKKIGRVDHKDAFLDTFDLEKDRGITIFSKQAIFPLNNYTVTLLDTPGHVDFSAEMERTLRVLDYAVLVINGSDGLQGHTLTVWKLLKRYHIPTIIFVNKMDLVGVDQVKLLSELQSRVHENCINFGQVDESKRWDELALCDEVLMEHYIDTGKLLEAQIQSAIANRHVFPVYFGSALKDEGVTELIQGLTYYLKPRAYPDIFGARVFKVSRNEQGERLTYIKVTGGSLKVKSLLTNKHQRNPEDGDQIKEDNWQEKVDQIRLYSGATFEVIKEANVGTVCVLIGLSMTKSGDGLGFESDGDAPSLVPVLSYKVILPQGTNVYTMLKNLRLLEEEEPHLNVVWNEVLGEIHIQVMGEIQIEILKSTIAKRFDTEVTFDKGNLVYQETIKNSVVGMGHFEPLKHYAEVHLLLEPLEIGQGLRFETNCSEDVMDRNWQRLVLSHLKEKQHKGILTGSTIRDMRITLVAGKGHLKHTEGGDFREATFRALRQGLMKAHNLLLEPVYNFVLELPKDMLGRAISDIERLYGKYDTPSIEDDFALIKGSAPVATMMHYSMEVMTYTKGQGRLSLSLKGYEPCHNSKQVIDEIGYNPDADNDNPSGSVFCKKGAGYGVPWNQVESHMHVESGIKFDEKKVKGQPSTSEGSAPSRSRSDSTSDQELEAIFNRTYGERTTQLPKSKARMFQSRTSASKTASFQRKDILKGDAHKNDLIKETFLLVDGYNIIFAWDNLKHLAEEHLDAARLELMDILCNYQGQNGDTVILVFDAYRVAGNRGEMFPYHNINVVYTKEAETADQYIERLVHDMRPHYEVTVATSDVVEQVIILGKGARRLSAEGFKVEVDHLATIAESHYKEKAHKKKHLPFEKYLSHDMDKK